MDNKITIIEGPPPAFEEIDDGWALMELELVEPELFFRLEPRLAERFADALVALVR